MNRMLAILNCETTAAPVLSATEKMAARFRNVRINALLVRPSQDPSFMPTEEVMTEERSRNFDRGSGALAERLRDSYETWRASLPDPAMAHLVEVVGDIPKVIAAEATQADLIVVGHGGQTSRGEEQQALHSVLYDADAPAVVVPRTAQRVVGAHPAVAWKQTNATEKAVNAALPLLLEADCVTILIARERSEETVPEPLNLLQVLERSGVRSNVVRFECGSQEVGPALLSRAKIEGADLMVMGAYAHNQFLELFIGGATHDILLKTDIPLLMHH